MQKTIDKMICLARGEIIVDFYIIFQISYQIPVSSERRMLSRFYARDSID